MTIGAMTHRITLENPKRIANPRGGWTFDYKTGDRMEVWAGAEILSIAQQQRYMQLESSASMQFLIRENPFVSEDTQIVFENKRFAIVQYAPLQSNKRFFDIRAREV